MAANGISEPDEDDEKGASRGPNLLALAWFIFLAGLLLLGGAIAMFGNPADGNPNASLTLKHGPAQTAAHSKPAKHAAAPHEEPETSADVSAHSGDAGAQAILDKAQAENGEPAVPPQIVPAHIEKPVYAGRALIADPALIQQTDAGPVPRIADDGRTPMAAYAGAVPAGKGPRIAIVISGLGISAKATAAAIDALPPGVTLAFAPYADDVQRWVSEARRQGHEVLLEVPMEPYDFPDSDPGPHTLRVTSGEDANLKRLTWSLTRFTGYAGVTNLLGGRFLASNDALAPVLTFLTRRGLLFFDAGLAVRSVSADVADQTKTTFAQGVVVLDKIQTGMEIDRRLSELESLARKNGTAAGTGFVYPVTVERTANWAKALQGRGFQLVPVSAIATTAK
ncbi:MAG TPA: divergent polysaccharide deacetylase family protein [Rhizomicrobium sp.]|nr:divergent polysaccharide deacetylase family protein [Rhizomicrobium sp.]